MKKYSFTKAIKENENLICPVFFKYDMLLLFWLHRSSVFGPGRHQKLGGDGGAYGGGSGGGRGRGGRPVKLGWEERKAATR